MFKDLMKFVLKFMARAVLARYHPKIIAITGSVGKTTTKEAIFHAVSEQVPSRASRGNYNNEIGLPLAILGEQSGRKNIFLFLAVVAKFVGLMLGRSYPRILVLEMAADRKGDIGYLASIARPDIAVVTRVGEAHTEFLGDAETIQREKSQLVRALDVRGVAVLNADDARVAAMQSLHRGKVVTFGLHPQAEVRAEEIKTQQLTYGSVFNPELDFSLRFVAVLQDNRIPIESPCNLGNPKVYAMLAALATAAELGLDVTRAAERLRTLPLQPGRLRPMSGIKRTVILDDSYNSSPEAAVESLRILTQIRAKRRLAVLADMLELGRATETAHRKIGRFVQTLGIDLLFCIGMRARFIAEEARAAGLAKSRIFEYASTAEAALPLQRKMQAGDAVLIKGSRGMHLEKVVLEVMAEPERAEELLVH
ncbi:MAG: UDP-N-acetylmuramoyl-tripeptide--D-alanyl-D-alanine ligase [Candidatus Doudnabacteria bacterium]|nr:UDP-N-acetylmuramoyl-tripeptide--D-alanyl-D-alanine ligase [Candidatus Doudnabacteria bacterium]